MTEAAFIGCKKKTFPLGIQEYSLQKHMQGLNAEQDALLIRRTIPNDCTCSCGKQLRVSGIVILRNGNGSWPVKSWRSQQKEVRLLSQERCLISQIQGLNPHVLHSGLQKYFALTDQDMTPFLNNCMLVSETEIPTSYRPDSENLRGPSSRSEL